MRENEGGWIVLDDARLAAIVRGAHDAILSLDPAGTILSWNGGATRLLGHRADDMIAAPISRIITDGGRSTIQAALGGILAGNATATIDTICMRADDADLPVTIRLSPMRETSGAVTGAAAIVRERRGVPRRIEWHRQDDRLASHALWGAPDEAAATDSKRGTVLVVEDEALIGLGLAAMLGNAGFNVFGPVADVPSAMDLLDRHDFALAILDIELRSGETSAPLAQRLKREGIPFFVTSGHFSAHQPAIFTEAPNFPKPVPARVIVAAVQNALG